MVDATISGVRMRDLTRLGRSRPRAGALAAPARDRPLRRRQSGTDAASIATGLTPRPRAASSRPGTDDLMASPI